MLPGSSPPPRRRTPFRAVTWLLLLLLGLLAWGVTPQSARPAQEYRQVQGGPPEVIPATGVLAEVFELARPAVVRLESHCLGAPAGHVPVGIGTGFFIDGNGTLLTAYHVVRAQRFSPACEVAYRARTAEGNVLDLELLAFDAVLDVALMSASSGTETPYLPLAERLPPSGSRVVAIGNSRGDLLRDRAGVVLRRNVTASRASFASGTVETTAALAPGDSGGPLLDEAGRVVGVVSYISYSLQNEPEAEGLIPRLIRSALDRPTYASYAVPVLEGGDLHSRLQAGDRRDVPVIGFSLQYDYRPQGEGRPLGDSPGVVVGTVQPGGPGERAGLRAYRQLPVRDSSGRVVGRSARADVIVALNGFATPTFDDLVALIYEYRVGDSVSLTVQRGAELEVLELVLAGRRDVFEQ